MLIADCSFHECCYRHWRPAAALQSEDPDNQGDAGWRQLVQVGEVFQGDSGLFQYQFVYRETGVRAWLLAWTIGPQPSHGALTD